MIPVRIDTKAGHVYIGDPERIDAIAPGPQMGTCIILTAAGAALAIAATPDDAARAIGWTDDEPEPELKICA